MHGLIGDDLFKNRSRARPGYACKHKKSPVEPGVEQMNEIPVERREPGVKTRKQVLAHADERSGPAWRKVEPPQKLLPGGFDAHGKPVERFRPRLLEIIPRRLFDRRAVRRKIACEKSED